MDIFSTAYMLLFLRLFVCVCAWQNDHNNKRYEQTTLLSWFSRQKKYHTITPKTEKENSKKTHIGINTQVALREPSERNW